MSSPIPSQHAYYRDWKRTPIQGESSWLAREAPAQASPAQALGPRLSSYLDRYGFGIPVDPHVEEEADPAVSTVGSYYARGRYGVRIIGPATRKAIFVYAG
jgi:hypothetical protein